MTKATRIDQVKLADIIKYTFDDRWWIFEVFEITHDKIRAQLLDQKRDKFDHGQIYVIDASWFWVNSDTRSVVILNR